MRSYDLWSEAEATYQRECGGDGDGSGGAGLTPLVTSGAATPAEGLADGDKITVAVMDEGGVGELRTTSGGSNGGLGAASRKSTGAMERSSGGVAVVEAGSRRSVGVIAAVDAPQPHGRKDSGGSGSSGAGASPGRVERTRTAATSPPPRAAIPLYAVQAPTAALFSVPGSSATPAGTEERAHRGLPATGRTDASTARMSSEGDGSTQYPYAPSDAGGVVSSAAVAQVQ